MVHGAGGLDELSTLGHTKVSEVRDGTVNTLLRAPVGRGPAAGRRWPTWRAGPARRTRTLVRRCSTGERGPRRDIVLLNAAAALLVAGRVAVAPRRRRARAAESIDSGAAAAALERMRRVSRS